MSTRKLLAALLALLFTAVLLVGCGGDRDGEDASSGDWSKWLTETSVEDPGAWFSVSVLPVE